ncbi:Spy/CpxP family protein refolding chaperone [Bradyrhizobium sp.]|uniref:Spy/CpxP family protein refolding chaperone n=1 Tax=Bradyrhizobium sp. TaxID=376 RepID=UPI00262D8AEC|nr:Spy/CpxP family protein refolding chaperone [Bradyrhizobium sp.]
MKNVTRILVVGATLLAAGGIGAIAIAQTAGPGFGPPFMHGPMGMGPGMMGGPQGHEFGDPAARLGALKTALGIKPGQANAWETYTKAIEATAARMRADRQAIDPQAIRAMPLKDRIAFMTRQMQRRDTALTDVKAAASTLMASLDDAQKAKARTLLPGIAAPGPSGMPMMRRGMGMMGSMQGGWH